MAQKFTAINAHLQLAAQLECEKRYNDAIKEIKLALIEEPNNDDVYYTYAQLLQAIEQYDQSILQLEKVVLLNPPHTDAHNDLGVLYFQKAEYEKAIEHLIKATSLDRNWTAHRNLGDVLMQLGRYNEALPVLEKIIKHVPDDIDVIQKINACRESELFKRAEVDRGCRKESLVLQNTNDPFPEINHKNVIADDRKKKPSCSKIVRELTETELSIDNCPATPDVQRMEARGLVTRYRLDLVLKYLFFKSLESGSERTEWEPFYRKHIFDRIAGVEFPKRSVEDFVSNCEVLLQSLRSKGFDPAQPISVFPDKSILNGAHRIACALATGNDVIVSPLERGISRTWDFRWFLERDYPQDVLAELLYHYSLLTRRALGIIILWGPLVRVWTRLTRELEHEMGVVGWLDLSFENLPSAFESIVRDMYSLQWGKLEQSHIRRKIIMLNQSRRVFRVLLVESLSEDGVTFTEQLQTVRDRIRCDYDHHIPNEAFCTCHASTSEEESRYLIELLLSSGSRKHRLLRSRGQPRTEFNEWLFKLAGELSKHGLSRNDVCIVGSSPLEVVGIRNSTNIDITLALRFRKRFGPGITHLNDWLDIVTEGYPRSSNDQQISDDQLIYDARNHFWYRGFKFASVDIVLKRKAFQARPKDLADVEAAKRFFSVETDREYQSGIANEDGAELISFLTMREKELKGERL